MKLYLLRHGIAVERVGGAIKSDFERPLTEEGRKELYVVGEALKRLNVKTDLVISSPLVRAKQTAEIIAEVHSVGKPVEISEALAPGGGASDIYKVLRKFSSANEVFLVGHEPDIGRLAGNLLWAGPEFDMPFKKAGVCRIDIADVPPSYPGRLKWFVSPKIMSYVAGK
jgi:phosphohistidine phosphatase